MNTYRIGSPAPPPAPMRRQKSANLAPRRRAVRLVRARSAAGEGVPASALLIGMDMFKWRV
ncbi:hypothetical protein [Streptomyces sp. NPDC058861]|uniref:hypothetical protein n=1 Tax=Streptomyces sp. NPDC058861 TaxID=3346653 RepID=UPI0036BB75FB